MPAAAGKAPVLLANADGLDGEMFIGLDAR
jgi:hypothetical protein